MKKKENKKFFFMKFILFVILSLFFVSISHWINIIWDYIKKQSAIWKGTNNNQIIFSNKKTTYYINEWNNNTLEWNKFVWYYYDNIYGFFRLDWSIDSNENIHISTDKVYNTSDWCSVWLKIKWKAYSKYVWFMDFNYNSNNFVYYCKDDNTIYWKWYSNILWTQVFKWIKIKNIKNNILIENILDNKWIVNDTNKIKEDTNDYINNNWTDNNIWGWDKYELEKNLNNVLDSNNNENTFWIIK